MKLICFSLYGSNPRYSIGALKNVQLIEKLLPGWKCVIYYDETVPTSYIEMLSQYESVECLKWVDKSIYGVFWRFYPFFASDDNICLSRDTDSRITEREVVCINEWIDSGKKFHIIRDHERHYDWPITAAMIGVRGKLDAELLESLESICRQSKDYYTIDQVWLRDFLWKQMTNENCLIHGIKETPWMLDSRQKLEDPFTFIGNGFDEHDKPLYHHLPHANININ